MRIQQHKTVMFNVLQVLFNSKYAKILGFKGGTALYFFYGLGRFSVDLDFDLLETFTKEETKELKEGIHKLLEDSLSKKGIKIKQEGTLDYSFKFMLQYGGKRKLKLEFNTKLYDNLYEMKSLLGTSVQVMNISYMFAHKLCAFFSRYQQRNSIANRDLYDIKFLLEKNCPINEGIIRIRSKKMLGKELTVKEYIGYLLDFIKENKDEINKNILDGIGELIDDSQKNNMKKSFLDDLCNQLELYIL